MDRNLAQEAEQLFAKLDQTGKFGTKFGVYPFDEAKRILTGMQRLEQTLPEVTPQTEEEVHLVELKRRLYREAHSLEKMLSGKPYDPETVCRLYGISAPEIGALRPWLEGQKSRVSEAIERIFQASEVAEYTLDIPTDIPHVRRGAEEFARIAIEKYHKKLGKMFSRVTQVGGYLRDIEAVPTTQSRSYFHPVARTLAIGIPAICYRAEDGTIHLRERELIQLYGHEGMGHALNFLASKASTLPSFIKRDAGIITAATCESVAQFYQNVIFDDLREDSETQRELGIAHLYQQIHQEAKDLALLHSYQLRLTQYAITVLADKSLGEHLDPEVIKRRIDLIDGVSLDPRFARNFVEGKRYSYDSEGNLDAALVSELRYAADPLTRARTEFERCGKAYLGKDRNVMDLTFLSGFWTPEGFVENARIKAQTN